MVNVRSIILAATTIASIVIHTAADHNATATCGPLQNDVAYTGTYLDHIRGVKIPAECCDECAKKSECVTFTWSPNSAYNGMCDLQQSLGATEPIPGSVSGARKPLSN